MTFAEITLGRVSGLDYKRYFGSHLFLPSFLLLLSVRNTYLFFAAFKNFCFNDQILKCIIYLSNLWSGKLDLLLPISIIH